MYWNLIRIAVWSGSDIQNYFANYIPPPNFCLISLWFAWMCVIVAAKGAIMLRNGRTHLNIQVNVNSIITISDILYNTTLIVLIQGMLIKSIHMTLQNISLSYTSFQQQFNRIPTNCPVKHIKQKFTTSLLLKLNFLGLSSLHYAASYVNRFFGNSKQ